MPYLIYFAGPFLLGALGGRLLRQPRRIFFIGFLAFFVAWVINQTVASVAMRQFHFGERTLVFALLASTMAGIVEEAARWLAFRRFSAFRDNHNWRSGLMYALGHHGMETVIVGLTALLIYFVVTHMPAAITDAETLRHCRAVAARSDSAQLFSAFQRLSVGLICHAAFTAVVMTGFVRRECRWLFVAIAWHFAHDMIGFAIQRGAISRELGRAWIPFILVVYPAIFLWLRQLMNRHVAPSSSPASP